MRHLVLYWNDPSVLIGRVGIDTAAFPVMVYGSQVACMKEAFTWAELANATSYEEITRAQYDERKPRKSNAI
jgi:hypothetical protein